jgi:hypothetical protein
LGWVWLPGNVYSPAWVEMRENDSYIAWAPVPPGVYIVNDAVPVTVINEDRYTVVEKKSFIEPSVYKYRYQVVENKNKIMIKEMTKTDGVMIKNKTVINKGPDVASIEKVTGKKIEQVKIKKVGKKEEAGLSGTNLAVFTPEIKKSKEVKNKPVSKPGKTVQYQDAKKITKEGSKEFEKEQKKEEKEVKKEQKKEEKELKKEQKKEEKKENKHENKEGKKENGKKDNGKDKGKK